MRTAGCDQVAHTERASLVLVIDRDEHARFIFRSILSHEGYEVVTATDGAAGLLICDATPPDAIVLDVDPPTCPSLDIVRAFTQHVRFRGRIIATTRRAMLHEQLILRGLPVAAILVKPVDPRSVVGAVRG